MRATEAMKRDFSRDGVRGLFKSEQLKRARDSFDYGVAHPSPVAGRTFKGTDDEHFNDQTNPKNAHQYIAMIKELGLSEQKTA